MVSWIYLAVSLWGAAFTGIALLRGKHLGPLMPLYFMAAWLTGELALYHLLWQAAATLGFGFAGAFRAWPGLVGLGVTFASWAGLVRLYTGALRLAPQLAASLEEQGLRVSPLAGRFELRPFHFQRPGTSRLRDVVYGPALPGDKGGRNLLDVIHPSASGTGRPILLQVHGGGWAIGNKQQQGQPLMRELASRGWVCFSINYRLSPRARFPDQIVDVKRAIAWIRENAAEYGGDPDFICITGGSAGGHLAALAALTPGDPRFQPGFEGADTTLAAAVPFYGVYDFLDRRGDRGRASMQPFLSRVVFKCTPEQDPELWDAMSPLSRIHADAPPFLVLHGSHDSLVFVEEARTFVAALREKSRGTVTYCEVPGAQHAFDTFHCVHATLAVRAATAFLEEVHARPREAT